MYYNYSQKMCIKGRATPGVSCAKKGRPAWAAPYSDGL